MELALPSGTADNDYLHLAGMVLSSGKSARLYKRLVYDDQTASSVRAYVDEREIASLFQVEATAKPGVDLAAVEKAVDEEMARFCRLGPDGRGESDEKIKAQAVAGFIRGIERIGGFGGKSDILAPQSGVFGLPRRLECRLRPDPQGDCRRCEGRSPALAVRRRVLYSKCSRSRNIRRRQRVRIVRRCG